MKRGLLITCLAILLSINAKSNDLNEFVYNVTQTNQPNCVVGAFCMFANERLNVKYSPTFWQTNKLTLLNQAGVDVLDIAPTWNAIFPSNHLTCIYNTLAPQPLDAVVNYERPYLWIGIYTNATKVGCHACLIYLHTNSVTFKHFVYNSYTHTKYTYNIDYNQFFKDTIQIYTLSK